MNNRLLVVGAIAVCFSCQSVKDTINEQESAAVIPIGEVFSAELENNFTKVVLQNNGAKVCFAPGDAILITQGNKSGRFVSTIESPCAQSDFSGETVFDNSGEPFWALYPYSTNSVISNSEITLTLPETQKATKESVDASAFFMIARSNTHKLSFKNVCGGIKFSVAKDSVSKVMFRGNNNEKIAGQARFTMDENGNPLRVSTSGSNYITIVPSGSQYFEKGAWYYCAVLPVELSHGYTMSFFKEDDENKGIVDAGVYECFTPVSIKRSVWGRIGNADDSVDYNLEAKNYYLLYRTTDDQSIGSCNWYNYQKDSFGDVYINYQTQTNSNTLLVNWSVKSDYDADSGFFIIDESPLFTYPARTLYANYFLADKDRVKEIVLAGNTLHPSCYQYTHLERATVANDRSFLSYKAFEGCSNLKEIKMPGRLLAINSRAFLGCSSLTGISIPRGVYKIEKDAFSYCTGLTEVHIFDLASWLKIDFENEYSNPLMYGHYLFINGANLKDLLIPNGVAIKQYAFFGARFDSLTIPSYVNIANIDNTAFNGCYSETINIGTPFDKWVFGNAGNVVFQEGIENIPNRALMYHEEIQSITLPSTISSIGDYAFANCTGISSITIPDGVTSIGEYAFQNCPNLKRITIGSQYALNTINAMIKNGELSGVEEIVLLDGITSIPESFLSRVQSIRRVELPSSITSIGNYALYGCPNLEYINIPGSVISVGDGFLQDSKPKRIVIGSLAAYNKLSFWGCSEVVLLDELSIDTIQTNRFKNNTTLTSITLPSSVSVIEKEAFYGCSNLIDFTIPPGVTTIENNTFYGCSCLKNITIHSGVTEIKASAFFGCASLLSFIIPDGIMRIESSTFGNCSSLSSINLPESVTTICNHAFAGCSNLESISIPSGVSEIQNAAFSGCTNLLGVNIPEGIKRIETYTFMGCSSLPSINIPESVISIGGSAFANCSKLESITIPSSVISIGGSAFANCSKLESLTIPSSVISAETGFLDNCSGLKRLDIKSYAAYEALFADTSQTTPYDKKVIEEVLLPDDLPIHEIKQQFKGCSSLRSFSIPSAVTTIYSEAFSGCSSLSSISIPEGVKTIYHDTFANCYNLSSIALPSGLIDINYSAFSGCRSLLNISIPESVISIGSSAFSGCSSITSITIPYGITSIPDFAFANCSSLTSISLPNSVTSFGLYTFSGCSSLKSISLPDNIISIGGYSFQYCRSLTSIIIPSKVTSIGNGVFYECTSLSSAVINAIKPPTLGYSAFLYVDNNFKIYVPAQSVDYYKKAEIWSDYKKIIFSM